MPNTVETSLLDQIGGAAAVDAAVEIFYGKVLADDRINGFFTPIDMTVQRDKQKKFITLVLSGKAEGAADYMRQAHKKLVAEQGLNDSHFDAVAEHLQASLEELKVPADLVSAIMGQIGGLRDPILDR